MVEAKCNTIEIMLPYFFTPFSFPNSFQQTKVVQVCAQQGQEYKHWKYCESWPKQVSWKVKFKMSIIFLDALASLDLVMGQFDTKDNLTPRTIWHRPCKEDNLTPRTIWHRGQFDTIMQNRTIWHRPCREDNLTPRTIWHRGQFDTIINFIFLQLFGPQIWLEIYWLPLSIFLTENYPV